MPVDKFGRMSDTKTKDTGVSLTYINNNYIRSDGGTPLTGSLDMKGNTIYNVADPVNPQDVVTKVYVDNTKGSGVIGRKIGDAASIKENLDFMGKQKIKNLPDPVNDKDAVTKEYVDTTTVPFLKLDQTKYNTKGDIDMGDQFTVYNVKTPIDDSHIVDKKYVDEMDNLKSAFSLKSGGYEAKGNIYLKKNKLGGLREPEQDNEPATKKYVDDLQTQYIDKRGNVRFDRNINVGNNRIFAVKDQKKDYEATNKKYVDESITKRLEEEKDKFLPQDPATKEYVDEAIKQVAGGDLLVSKEGVFIKENGHYRSTAPLDIDNQKMENLPDPVDEKDAVNKKYIDEIVENLTLKQGLVRENGGFNLVDSYINMNFNNIRNVGNPEHEADAVPRSFVDDMIGSLKETTEKTIVDALTRLGKMLTDGLKKRTHIISASASFQGDLIAGDYQFTWGGQSMASYKKHDVFNGFLVPRKGKLENFVVLDTGLKFNVKKNVNIADYILEVGVNKPLPLFTLVLIRLNQKPIDLGTLYFSFTNFEVKNSYIYFNIEHVFKHKKPFEGKVIYFEAKDIINIRSEVNSFQEILKYRIFRANPNHDLTNLDDEFFTYLATVLIELDPLQD